MKIASNKEFHGKWQELMHTIEEVLSEAHTDVNRYGRGTFERRCEAAAAQLLRLKTMMPEGQVALYDRKEEDTKAE